MDTYASFTNEVRKLEICFPEQIKRNNTFEEKHLRFRICTVTIRSYVFSSILLSLNNIVLPVDKHPPLHFSLVCFFFAFTIPIAYYSNILNAISDHSKVPKFLAHIGKIFAKANQSVFPSPNHKHHDK